ncbi:MAG: hypothetical protein NVV74_14415 [Magnetospirillum sp.]|nr:hypothetical protein [Magnetospirillum sp.]
MGAPAERVLTVVAGGGDSARDWVFALAEGGLDATRHGPVTLVVGAAFPERERLERCCRAAGFTLLSGLPATRLAARMAASSAVLVTGGMVAYEAAAVGVPAVINPLLDDMREEIAAFAAAGAALDLQGGGMDMARIDAALSSLMDNRERAHTMSQRQRTLVDGRGLARCAAILDSLLERP